MTNEKKYCIGCNNEESFRREFVVVHEEINGRFSSVEKDVAQIKQDVTELKVSLTANSSNLTNLIQRLDKERHFQYWALAFVITMCASFGVYLVNSSFQNKVEIEKMKMEHQQFFRQHDKV